MEKTLTVQISDDEKQILVTCSGTADLLVIRFAGYKDWEVERRDGDRIMVTATESQIICGAIGYLLGVLTWSDLEREYDYIPF